MVLIGQSKQQADFKQHMAELDDKLEPGQQLVLWRLDPRPEMPLEPKWLGKLALANDQTNANVLSRA